MSQDEKTTSQVRVTPRIGYENEAALIQNITENIEVFIPKGSFVFSTELTLGAGAIDVVLGEPQVSCLIERLKYPTPIRGVEAVVLSHLYLQRPLRASTIASRTGLDEPVTLKSLEKLQEYGLCNRHRLDTFVRSPVTEQFTSLIAIEGKLRSWKRALQQAARNRFFSTRSFVVLDAKYAAPAIANLDLFRTSGVGLATANAEDRTVRVVLNSGRAPHPISNLYFFLAREELTRRVANQCAFLSEDLRVQIQH